MVDMQQQQQQWYKNRIVTPMKTQLKLEGPQDLTLYTLTIKSHNIICLGCWNHGGPGVKSDAVNPAPLQLYWHFAYSSCSALLAHNCRNTSLVTYVSEIFHQQKYWFWWIVPFGVSWLIGEQIPQGLCVAPWAGNRFFPDSSRYTQVPKMGSICYTSASGNEDIHTVKLLHYNPSLFRLEPSCY